MIIGSLATLKGIKTGLYRFVCLLMSASLDRSVILWDLRVNACQGILHLRGRPAVAYDQQGLVFAIAMEVGAVKLFDSRCYDKGPFDTFLVVLIILHLPQMGSRCSKHLRTYLSSRVKVVASMDVPCEGSKLKPHFCKTTYRLYQFKPKLMPSPSERYRMWRGGRTI
ncbi:PREDICTED: uncharacterized protein LOC104766973 isoform X3 [Camelina sativa]|uniref:Uncharacterized protein LOC104766973 isoform X3 n=1 Tax=Camelina sativa TaxID=90675 RepID=A0ABM0XQ62_CAMSA|nr:PREDICTED: uncharacterized protein LOC104766973 isoform X3 [Camelina sativa]